MKNKPEDGYGLLSKKNSSGENEFISVPYYISTIINDNPITKLDYWGESRNHLKSILEINTESFYTIGLYVLKLNEFGNKEKKALINLSTILFDKRSNQNIDTDLRKEIIELEKSEY